MRACTPGAPLFPTEPSEPSPCLPPARADPRVSGDDADHHGGDAGEGAGGGRGKWEGESRRGGGAEGGVGGGGVGVDFGEEMDKEASKRRAEAPCQGTTASPNPRLLFLSSHGGADGRAGCRGRRSLPLSPRPRQGGGKASFPSSPPPPLPPPIPPPP